MNDFAAFSNLSVKQQSGKFSELVEYLRLPVENVPDPLRWWIINSHLYPNLSRMARDYLSIPGMSSHLYYI